MFASLTAHTTALLPVLLTAAIAVPEMPVKLISLLFCYTLGSMGIISPYATGPGPIYYGSGYVSRKEFWTLGLIFGGIYLAARSSDRCALSQILSGIDCSHHSRQRTGLAASEDRKSTRLNSSHSQIS